MTILLITAVSFFVGAIYLLNFFMYSSSLYRDTNDKSMVHTKYKSMVHTKYKFHFKHVSVNVSIDGNKITG